MSSQWISSSGVTWFDCGGRRFKLGVGCGKVREKRARLEIIGVNGRTGAICPLPISPSN
jgi:hypothetical protein